MSSIKLTEIAERIRVHLKRFEADPEINKLNPTYKTSPYWNAGAHRAGSYVRIKYVSYQHGSTLSKADALAYLEWLDAGNVGKHAPFLRGDT
ncbi:MAG: hypothetical protein ACTSX8_05130 [Alphaproteobacteria bacterium]